MTWTPHTGHNHSDTLRLGSICFFPSKIFKLLPHLTSLNIHTKIVIQTRISHYETLYDALATQWSAEPCTCTAGRSPLCALNRPCAHFTLPELGTRNGTRNGINPDNHKRKRFQLGDSCACSCACVSWLESIAITSVTPDCFDTTPSSKENGEKRQKRMHAWRGKKCAKPTPCCTLCKGHTSSACAILSGHKPSCACPCCASPALLLSARLQCGCTRPRRGATWRSRSRCS